MLEKNLKYYRLAANMSQQELADKVGMQKMTISNYENGKRQADSATVIKLAKALGVKTSSLLLDPAAGANITHGAYRKKKSTSQASEQVIFGCVDRYLGRFNNTLRILNEPVLPEVSEIKKIPFVDIEDAGQKLRQYFGLAATGPIGNIVDIIENHGIILCQLDIKVNGFSGLNGTLNGRPYIVINTNMPAERQRFTIFHELSHILFDFPADVNEENLVDGITGAFLLPAVDVKRELGVTRTNIRGELRLIQREYGVSMQCILLRAKQSKVITDAVYESHQKWISASGLRTDERSNLTPERSTLLERLVIRAFAEGMINLTKAAELLDKPYEQARRICTVEA